MTGDRLLAGSEPVADAEHSLDILRVARVGLDLRAQIANMHIDRALVALVCRALQPIQQLEPR